MSFDTSKMVAFDLETYLIELGILAPTIVCGSVAELGCEPRLMSRHEAVYFARDLLLSDKIIVGANIAYDMGCLAAYSAEELLPAIFKAYEDGRVYDVQIAQALHAIAEGNLYIDPVSGQPMRGRYSLKTCVQYVLGRDDAKVNDEWRLRYSELDGVPISEWPETARQYPIDDAVNTLEVAIAQVNGGGSGCTPGPHRNLGDMSAQVETAFALHLGAIWGLRTDPARVAALKAKTEKSHESFMKKFQALGFIRANGSKDMKAIKQAVIAAYSADGVGLCGCAGGKTISAKTGKPVNCTKCSGTGLDISGAPSTAGGGVSADRDTLVESGDLDLASFGDNEPEKILTTYLPKLETEELGRSLRPNVLVASGRTSYDGLIQLMPQKGGVRECHKARPDRLYCYGDFAALELCTFAQISLWTVGFSQMAETINATGDPGALHTAFAASMMGITTEQAIMLIRKGDVNAKKFRQAAKAKNFGALGGMGAPKFVLAKRKKSEGETEQPDGKKVPGIRFCLLLGGAERCGIKKIVLEDHEGNKMPPMCKACLDIVSDQLDPAWRRQWPEAPAYHEWVKDQLKCNNNSIPSHRVDRWRGNVKFTAAANHGFQALAADGAKRALRAVVRESYLDRESPLWGARPIFFTHDEITSEIFEYNAPEAAARKAEVMVREMRVFTPDVTVRVEPSLSRYWSKAAGDPVFNDEGILIPYEDREAA